MTDMWAVLLAWGDSPASCPEDVNDDGVVDLVDLWRVLLDWET